MTKLNGQAVCEYCSNTGQMRVTVEPIKKGEFGWCRVMPCTKCQHGIKYIRRMDDISDKVTAVMGDFQALMNKALFPNGREQAMKDMESRIHYLNFGKGDDKNEV